MTSGSNVATGPRPPLHFTGRGSNAVRALLQAVALWPVVRWFCHPLTVDGASALPRRPVVFVANHASHADTAVILKALPFSRRRRMRPAAAEDHFWRTEVLGAFVSLLTGAFPFPRRGCAGIERARSLLDAGNDVLLFPEGTRSRDGSIGDFHKGVALLAKDGATIVPVGISGTASVLPKGASRPRSAPVAVVFGPALSPGGDADAMTTRLRAEVVRLRDEADALVRHSPPRAFDKAAGAARSRWALVAMLTWAVAEALAWPVIPDFLLLPLVVLAPARWKHLCVAALVGSLLGGMVSYATGPTGAGAALLDNAPLVTERMTDVARERLESGGAPALLTQPLAGIPYKAFSYQSAAAGVAAGDFVLFSALARGARFLAVGLLAALAGRFLRPLWERFGPHLLVVYAAGFGVGLARVVAAWS